MEHGMLLAQGALGGLKDAGKAAGYDPGQGLPGLIGSLIAVVLSLLGVALVILLIYAGILYLTAAGNEERVKQAKRIMINSIIGIVIVVSAYAISAFVIDRLSGGTTSNCPPGQEVLDPATGTCF